MKASLDELQGVWAIAALEVNGAPVPAASLAGATITVSGERFSTKGMGAEYTGRMGINAAVLPHEITMHFETGPESGLANHGIWEILEDGWRLCLNMTGGPAPREFGTAPGDGLALERLVRREADAVVVRAPAGVGAVDELQGEWAMVSCVRSGESLPGAFVKSGRRRIEGTRSTLHFGPQLFMEGELSSDTGGARFVRLEHTGGEARGTTQLGIYEIAGGKLKTCFGGAGKARPERFESTAEGGETYSVWRRLG